MARSGMPIGLGERGLSLFSRRPSTPPKTYVYDLVADFGAAPGDTAATTAALQAFNAEAQKRTRPPQGPYPGCPGYYADANPDHMIILKLPAGTFTHTWNQYTKQIRNLKIIGAGSDQTFLQNVNSSSQMAAVALHPRFDYFGSWYDESSDVFGGGSGDNQGYLIDTAAAGATQVRLKSDFGNASRFLVGRWALVYSYSQQQYGYPTNARYYDWAMVTGVDTSGGIIFLDRPLLFEHRDDRPFFGSSLHRGSRARGGGHGLVGPARIAHIDHPDKTVFVYQEFRGFHVLGNPRYHWGGAQSYDDAFYIGGCIDCLVDDVVIDNHLGTSLAKRIHIRNSSWGVDESDKIVGDLLYDNCNVGFTQHHAGQLLWRAIGGNIRRCSISCLEARLQGVLIDGMSNAGDWQHGVSMDVPNAVEELRIEGCTFRGRNHRNNRPISNPPLNGPYTIGTDGATITLPGGNGTSLLRITKDNSQPFFATSWQIVDNWGEGHTLWKNGAKVNGAAVARITGDNHYIYVDCTGVTFNAGDTVAAARVQRLVVQDCMAEDTGFNWNSPWIGETIPEVTWIGNQGN